MAFRYSLVALGLIVAASPVSASLSEDGPAVAAPAAGPNALYCLRVEPVTGSRLETVQCWTREEWASQEVDVDKEWAEEGVRVLG